MDDLDLLREKRRALARQLRIAEARESLPAFLHLMMPDEVDPSDPDKSSYQLVPHGRLLCDIIERTYKGILKRSAVAIPPQHGKTIHLSTFGPAWILGLNPKARIVIATYNETRADELGEAFRKAITSDAYHAIFPTVELEKGSKSKSAMSTTAGGKIFFVGAGGTITGRTADYFIIDDPMKDDEELQSPNFRDKMWKWFFSVAYSRGGKRTRIIVLHTRWHTDDLIGRLCDPLHPERGKSLRHDAKLWTYINLSGVVQRQDLADALGLKLEVPTDPQVIAAFGAKPMAALWEAEKDLPFFAEWKMGEPRTFSALVMGQPTQEEGDYFRAEWLVEYSEDELPDELRIYGASDHAVSTNARRDYTVIGCIGVDKHDTIWVLPDLVWDRMETPRTVEELLHQFKAHKPGLWWMENELISKSFGPFLKKRMIEEKIYCTIDPVTPSKDKRTRARAIQGRMQMKKVKFPRFAPWWSDARSQLLQFDAGANDDFVDWLAHVGQGLLKETRASTPVYDERIVKVGSPVWVLKSAQRRARNEKRKAATAGW
jgi:predicted phage terminase large subunit-like protein